MTTIKRIDYWQSTGLALLAAGVLLLWPVTALALPKCPARSAADLCGDSTTYPTGDDCDGDGFTNEEECTFITTPTGRTFYYFDSTDSQATANDKVLDPSKPDLFYLVSDINNSDLTATDPAGKGSLLFSALTSEPNAHKVYSDALEVRTHLIKNADCDSTRVLTGTTRAARIRESLSTAAEGTYLGSTPQSKPSDQNVASTIYTQKIYNNVADNCTGQRWTCSVKGTSPLIVADNGIGPIVNYYILQVVSHEMGHGSLLAATTPASYYHYSKSGTVMDPATTFSRGVYTIPTAYNLAKDQAAMVLH